MKIAIPMEEKDLNANVCPSFGRAPYFLFWDTDAEKAEYVPNTAATSPGGAGIKAAQLIADGSVQALLVPRCGENAVNVLTQAGIPLYKTIPGTARQNIDAFGTNRLAPLADVHPGFHGHEQ